MKLSITLLFFVVTPNCFAQVTVVTGTVKDGAGVPYAGASMKAQLVLAGAAVNGQPTVTVTGVEACRSSGFGSSPCKVPFQGTAGPFSLDSTGSFSQTLQDNTLVTPAGTQWLFSVTISPGVVPPAGTGPQSCSATLTITGASQSLSSSFNACPALLNGGVSPSLGAAINVKSAAYAAAGDTAYAQSVSLSRTASTLTLPAGSTAKNGQLIQCASQSFGGEVVPYPATNGGQVLPATITSVVGQIVTYNTNPVGAGGVLADGVCVWATADDTTALTNAFNACKTASKAVLFNGPTQNYPCNVYVPAGGYMVKSTPFNETGSGGNTMGVGILGDGNNASVIYPIIGYTNSSPANCGWLICGYGWGQSYKDFGVELIMSGYVTGGIAFANEDLIKLNCGKCLVENIKVENWYNGGAAQYMVNDAGGAELHYLRLENPLGGATGARAFLCSACSSDVFDPFFSNTTQNLAVSNVTGRGSGQYLNVHGGIIDEGAIPLVAASKAVAFMGTTLMGGANCLSVDATSEVRMTGGYCGSFLGNPGGGGPTVTSGGKLWMTAVEVSANGVGQYCYNSPTYGGIIDLGGNTCLLAGGATTYNAGSAGLQFSLTTDSTTQLGGRQTVAGTAPTCSVTGAGSTGTCTIDAGSTDAAGKLTITANGAGIAALGTFTLTFTTVSGAYGTNGTACTGNFMNGTGAWNARAGSPIFTTLGTTTQIANWDNNAVALTGGSTYKVTYGCYGQ